MNILIYIDIYIYIDILTAQLPMLWSTGSSKMKNRVDATSLNGAAIHTLTFRGSFLFRKLFQLSPGWPY